MEVGEGRGPSWKAVMVALSDEQRLVEQNRGTGTATHTPQQYWPRAYTHTLVVIITLCMKTAANRKIE